MGERSGGAPGVAQRSGTEARADSAIASALLLTPRWTRDGGVASHVMASAEALAGEGLDVRVLCARAESDERIGGVEVLEHPGLFDEQRGPAARLGPAFDGPPDVVHVHQVDDPALVRFLRARAPVVVSAHGYTACTSGVHYFQPGEECMRAHGPGCIPNLTLRGCAHTNNPGRLPRNYRQAGRGLRTLHECDLAIAYSTAVDRHLAINGIEERAIVPLFTTLGPARGAEHESGRRVLFAGRIVAPKGVAVLIRAAREVDAEFVICGDGWRLAEMRELAARTGVTDRVRFTGWLAPRELAQEIAEASVVAMPSLWPEPFGLGGIEAFEAGRPVVASLTGGIRDWLADGVNGLGVKPGDAGELARALNELLDDPGRRREMGAAGREMAAARFSAASHLSALLGAYRSAREAWEAGAPAPGARAVGDSA
ncbi:MAG TPA: glycosyltransferase family 4 protein [Solirubrobacteraceae bacterium]